METPQNHHSSLDDFEKWNQQTLIPRSLLVWMHSTFCRATSSRIQPIAGRNFSLSTTSTSKKHLPKMQKQKIFEAASCGFMSSLFRFSVAPLLLCASNACVAASALVTVRPRTSQPTPKINPTHVLEENNQ